MLTLVTAKNVLGVTAKMGLVAITSSTIRDNQKCLNLGYFNVYVPITYALLMLDSIRSLDSLSSVVQFRYSPIITWHDFHR